MPNTCIVCGKGIADRKGKLYCSDSCKQKAYVLRKDGTPTMPIVKEPGSIKFSYDEYDQWLKEFKQEETFVYYCFLRKNLTPDASLQLINNIINDTLKDAGRLREKILNETTAIGKDFAEFEKQFFSKKFEIVA